MLICMVKIELIEKFVIDWFSFIHILVVTWKYLQENPFQWPAHKNFLSNAA